MNLKSRAASPGPSPAGGPVVPGPPIWNLCPPISRLASWLLHTSNTVFKKCAPPSVFWPPLLLNPGDGPGLHPTHLLTRSNELKQIFPTCRLQTTFDKRHWRFIFSPDWQLILCKASYFAEGRLLLTNNVLDTSSYTLRRASINSERLHEEGTVEHRGNKGMQAWEKARPLCSDAAEERWAPARQNDRRMPWFVKLCYASDANRMRCNGYRQCRFLRELTVSITNINIRSVLQISKCAQGWSDYACSRKYPSRAKVISVRSRIISQYIWPTAKKTHAVN